MSHLIALSTFNKAHCKGNIRFHVLFIGAIILLATLFFVVESNFSWEKIKLNAKVRTYGLTLCEASCHTVIEQTKWGNLAPDFVAARLRGMKASYDKGIMSQFASNLSDEAINFLPKYYRTIYPRNMVVWNTIGRQFKKGLKIHKEKCDTCHSDRLNGLSKNFFEKIFLKPKNKKSWSYWMKKPMSDLTTNEEKSLIAYYTRFKFPNMASAKNTFGICLTCHDMTYAFERHKSSSHFLVATCDDCHIPHGPLDWSVSRLKGLKDLFVHFVNPILTQEEYNARRPEMVKDVWSEMNRTDSDTCRYCHNSIEREEHENKNKICIDCHKNIMAVDRKTGI